MVIDERQQRKKESFMKKHHLLFSRGIQYSRGISLSITYYYFNDMSWKHVMRNTCIIMSDVTSLRELIIISCFKIKKSSSMISNFTVFHHFIFNHFYIIIQSLLIDYYVLKIRKILDISIYPQCSFASLISKNKK